MWECQECGQENDDSFPHCMSCGLERTDAPPSPAVPEPAPAPTLPGSEWDLTRTVARVVSFVGWAVVVLGVLAAPIMLIVVDTSRGRLGEFLLALLLQTLGTVLAGLVLVLIGHIARAVVETTENSGRISEILESECGNLTGRSN